MSIPFGGRPGVPNMNMEDITKLFGAGQALLGGLLGGAEEQRQSGETEGYKTPKQLGFLDKLVINDQEQAIETVDTPKDGIVTIRLKSGVAVAVPETAKLRVA